MSGKRIRRPRFVVVRAILSGRPVVGGAGGLEQLVKRRVLGVLRTHEHQVLEEVRESGATGLFIAGADAEPDVRHHAWNGVIFVHNQREAVGQRVDRRGDAKLCRLCAGQRGQQERQAE
jgi:hypothetical protein